MRTPTFKESFLIESDASAFGMGGIIYQKHGIISYYSKKYSKSQMNYTVTEKECLAIIECLKNWPKIVFESKVIIKTDQANLLL